MPNAPIASPLIAKVVDAQGNPVAGVGVNWSVPQGGGALSALTSTSDANGLVQASYAMGPGPEDNKVRVSLADSSASYEFLLRNQQTAVVLPATQLIAPMAQIALGTPSIQLKNIDTYLTHRRSLSNPTVTNGLKVSYDGKPLPLLYGSMLAMAPTAGDNQSGLVPQASGLPDHDPFERFGFFVQGDIDIARQDAMNGRGAFDVRTNGLTLGADYRFAGNNVLGAALGLMKAKSGLADSVGDVEAKGYSFSVFGEYVPVENAYVDLTMNYGQNTYDTTRRVTASGIGYTSDPREISSASHSRRVTSSTSRH
jgi:hypothetical protein